MQNTHLLAYLQHDVAPEQPLLIAGSYERCATHPAVVPHEVSPTFPERVVLQWSDQESTNALEPIMVHAMEGWRLQLLGTLSPLHQVGKQLFRGRLKDGSRPVLARTPCGGLCLQVGIRHS